MTMGKSSAEPREAAAAGAPSSRPISGFWLRTLSGAVRHLAVGQLTLIGPDGGSEMFAASKPGPHATLEIKRPRAVWRLFTGGDVGFAESYLAGDWDSPDLAALIELAARNEAAMTEAIRGFGVVRAWHRLRHLLRPNSRTGSRRNIADHYDLGNDFYRLWLDPTMTYSSAIFAEPQQQLSDGQIAKYRRLAESLDLKRGHRVLEIGCGWGGFAEFTAANYGCHVTGITLSQKQQRFAEARVAQAGLKDQVRIALTDYRDVTGPFDRIASIEMFEAVGEAHWQTFFHKVRDLLAPGGLAALQVILIEEDRFDLYRRSADFIQRYVFPGGMLPSPRAFARAAEAARLKIDETFHFGLDYARTLSLWQREFQQAWPRVAHLGFDARFKRLWEYYLAYCEGGFRAGSIDVAQFRIVRP
ncbi:MAG TPA: cyclopropane-fatty-acyl-phospholipid synthase family protein [Dongiaceae bacterium]|nr:cyclopropane-fatty-acyl-phospholipid synthase family protein [Dongiaceae bacterium]